MVHFEGILRTDIVVTALAEYKKLCLYEGDVHRAKVIDKMLDEIEKSSE